MVTPEAINFMAMHARGLICMPMEEARLKALNIHPMVENNTDNHETAFTVSLIIMRLQQVFQPSKDL